jgi:hypothetical protein
MYYGKRNLGECRDGLIDVARHDVHEHVGHIVDRVTAGIFIDGEHDKPALDHDRNCSGTRPSAIAPRMDGIENPPTTSSITIKRSGSMPIPQNVTVWKDYSEDPAKIKRSSHGATRKMFVLPGVLNGTPAVTTTISLGVAIPDAIAARTASITAVLKRSTTLTVITQFVPQLRARRRTVLMSLDSTMIGTRGRSRDVKSAVVPD